MHATRAAVEEGIVPGGGVALVRGGSALDGVSLEDADEQTGVNIVRRSLEAPLRWIAQNAGQEGAIVIERVRNEEGNTGYDANADRYCDLVEAGIIDPAKVTRNALQNAASIAGLMLTTEATVHEIPEEQPAAPAGPPDHDF